MSDAETLDSLRRWLREQEDLLRVRDAEIKRLHQLLNEWLDDGIVGPRDLEKRTREALRR